MPALRHDLADIPTYVPGQPPSASSADPFKLSSNEVAEPLSGSVIDAGLAALRTANRYPDLAGRDLVQRLALTVGVPAELVVVSGGSIAVLQELLLAGTEPGDRVVFGWRSYEAYPIVVRVARLQPVAVPLVGPHHDLAAMADAVRVTGARVVIVCSPNNPTGAVVGADELALFLDAVPTDCLVVIDEAYREFVAPERRIDTVGLVGQRTNVVVLRTFSKAHGLAGLRVGYGIAAAPVAAAIRRVALPFAVNTVAQRAAVAALDCWPERRRVVDAVTRRRDDLLRRLDELGVPVTASQANFVWLPWNAASTAMLDQLAERGVSVRPFRGEGLRISVGEPAALDQVLRVAAGHR